MGNVAKRKRNPNSNKGPEGGLELDLTGIGVEDIKRFLSKIQLGGAEGCDLWCAGVTKDGYGRFGWKGRTWGAHKFSHALFNSAVPAGLTVMHTCDTPGCVRSEHLELGTTGDNNRSCRERGRHRYISYKGELNGHSKLTKSIILEAARLYRDEGLSAVELAEKYNVSQSNITCALSGRSFSDLVIPNFNYKEIAKQHHRESNAKNVIKAREAYRARGKANYQKNISEVLRLRAEGLTYMQLAKVFEVSDHTIRKWLKAANCFIKVSRPIPQSKILDTLEMIRMTEEGMSQRQIAEVFEVSQSTVHLWLKAANDSVRSPT